MEESKLSATANNVNNENDETALLFYGLTSAGKTSFMNALLSYLLDIK